MKFARALLLGFGLCLAAGACTQAAPRELEYPPALTAAIAENRQFCEGAGGVFNLADSIEAADLNQDGAPDFILRDALLVCDGAASIFVGNSGGGVAIFDGANQAANAATLFQAGVHGYFVESSGGGSVVYILVGGPMCGRAPTGSRAGDSAVLCERPLHWNLDAGRIELSPLSDMRPFRPDFSGYK